MYITAQRLIWMANTSQPPYGMRLSLLATTRKFNQTQENTTNQSMRLIALAITELEGFANTICQCNCRQGASRKNPMTSVRSKCQRTMKSNIAQDNFQLETASTR